jgi:Asp-tRNA(Asn)/Glu-tRNA(Gln) amidotransferase A subunit family amidase
VEPAWTLTGAAAARAIRAGKLTAEALVAACLERIAARDGALAAWDAALAQARALDRMPARVPLLTPSARGKAPKGLASTGDSLFNRVWTLLGVPCITLPSGNGANGLPLGIQLVSGMNEDTALLARADWAAKALA